MKFERKRSGKWETKKESESNVRKIIRIYLSNHKEYRGNKNGKRRMLKYHISDRKERLQNIGYNERPTGSNIFQKEKQMIQFKKIKKK